MRCLFPSFSLIHADLLCYLLTLVKTRASSNLIVNVPVWISDIILGDRQKFHAISLHLVDLLCRRCGSTCTSSGIVSEHGMVHYILRHLATLSNLRGTGSTHYATNVVKKVLGNFCLLVSTWPQLDL